MTQSTSQSFAESPEMVILKAQITAAKNNLQRAKEEDATEVIDFWQDRMDDLLDVLLEVTSNTSA